jgi:hypothetical protein
MSQVHMFSVDSQIKCFIGLRVGLSSLNLYLYPMSEGTVFRVVSDL